MLVELGCWAEWPRSEELIQEVVLDVLLHGTLELFLLKELDCDCVWLTDPWRMCSLLHAHKGMAHSSLQALSLFTELGLCGYAFRLREAFQASLRDSEKSCDHHARAPSNAVHCDVCDCKCFLCA